MTQRSVEPSAPPTPPASPKPPASGNPLERIQAWLRVEERRLRRIPLVQAIQNVLDTYNAAGGGITSSGLAYGALFAVIPGLLLIVSLLVIVVDTEVARQEVIDWIIKQVPPLEAFATDIVASVANQARVGSVIGLVLFIWGASGFYLGLEGAMVRLFPGPRRRDPIVGRLRGAIAVVIVVGAVLAMFVANTLATGFGLRPSPRASSRWCPWVGRWWPSWSRRSWRSRSTCWCRPMPPAGVRPGRRRWRRASASGCSRHCSALCRACSWAGSRRWARSRRCSWRWSGSTGCSRSCSTAAPGHGCAATGRYARGVVR